MVGDDKDRVLKKSDGTYTYFAPDIAYHDLKLSRGYNKIFDILGADHKSYANQMTIAIQLLNFEKKQLHVCIMQIVQLLKNGKEFNAGDLPSGHRILGSLLQQNPSSPCGGLSSCRPAR